MTKIHSFHIPVMGIGFSIDTPVKVAQYGISSVISLVDDYLIEEIRKYYCKVMDKKYVPITKYEKDFRAKRITAYLNLVDQIVKKKFKAVQSSRFEIGSEITKYFEMLSDRSPLKALYHKMLETTDPRAKKELQERLRSKMRPGDIDVNIMTKLDRTNYAPDRKELPAEFSDALAALRGYANSTLNSAIVFSAGINRRLYSYVEKFEDFYADASGFIKKKIILKVSDYRSSIIQGRFLAKKGLWVSEYRVESGLNCGGHTFASDGYLMGPILEEFKNKRQELISGLHKICNEVLKLKKNISFDKPLETRVTAQGGIGTVQEDQFLLDHYQIDGTGWATPFLLCPEVTNVDEETLKKLADAKQEDIYLSDVSPLNVPFSNLRNSNSDLEKQRRADEGRPGSACLEGHLAFNTEITEQPICIASRQYQKLKIEELKKLDLSPEEYQSRYEKIIEKACICHDLSQPPLINYGIGKKGERRFTAVCPGPNLAYFSNIVSLKEMVDHIYGRINLLNSQAREHMFIAELRMYVDYFKKEVEKSAIEPAKKQMEYVHEFKKNLMDGIEYYLQLFPNMAVESAENRQYTLEQLNLIKQQLAASFQI
ncbi:MAG: hypothetical protein JW847_08275 [Candidatus Omnitrophica bacterium]|nr:hypothetical protein [Candidatus Omnitrophota bacterium]